MCFAKILLLLELWKKTPADFALNHHICTAAFNCKPTFFFFLIFSCLLAWVSFDIILGWFIWFYRRQFLFRESITIKYPLLSTRYQRTNYYSDVTLNTPASLTRSEFAIVSRVYCRNHLVLIMQHYLSKRSSLMCEDQTRFSFSFTLWYFIH